LRGLLEPIIGRKAMPMAFPLLICFFLFILIHNWSGLIPGVGTIGWGIRDVEGHFHMTTP
jgi:F-type H+-transporting ATPase subunit a